MSFDGRDYHQAFEDARAELVYETDPDVISGKLEHVEWVLCEAIRSVFFWFSLALGGLIGLPVGYILRQNDQLFLAAIVSCVLLTVVATAAYWMLRLFFYFEVSRHIQGRTFGDL